MILYLDISAEVAAQVKFIGKRRLDARLHTPKERELIIEDEKLYERLRISNSPHDHMLVDKRGADSDDEDA